MAIDATSLGSAHQAVDNAGKMAMGRENILCAPINIDAFVLNPKVCDEGGALIAPITQPDYTGLRLNSSEIQPDILATVDLSACQPASVNARITAVEAAYPERSAGPSVIDDVPFTPPTRRNRVGVYLHWSLPRMYRAGVGAGALDEDLPTKENRSQNPDYRQVPNRWLVVRHLKSYTPSTATGLPKVDGWVVESDTLRTADELGEDVDLESDVSPFVQYQAGQESQTDILDRQAQHYLGEKISAGTWRERSTSVRRLRPLTVMNSSNLYFADNTHHNANVFSMVDSFAYVDAAGQTAHLESAECDYVVIGWHSKDSQDPLGRGGLQGSFEERCRSLFLRALSSEWWEKNRTLTESTRLIFHGAIYNVSFAQNVKPPTPADQYAKLFTADEKMEPIAIGVTPLDATLSFLQAHKSNADQILGAGTSEVAADIVSMTELLYATEDGYDGRAKASDVMSSAHFMRTPGGNYWQFDERAERGKPPVTPTDSQKQLLAEANNMQDLYNAAIRKRKMNQWLLFTVWWNFISDPMASSIERQSQYMALAAKFRDLILSSQKIAETTKEQIDAIVGTESVPPKVPARSIPRDNFHQRKDPSICIAGIPSGWPLEYLGHLDFRALRTVSGFSDGEFVSSPLPQFRILDDDDLHIAVKLLLNEALPGQDHGSLLGFKKWTGQPFCPLFLEWEATYFHIPFDKWSVALQSSPMSNNQSHARYVVKEALSDDPAITHDRRTVGGRIMVLPQPAFSLEAIVAQVLDIAGLDLPPDLEDPAERENFLRSIRNLNLMSGELQGITTHLLTTMEGSHVAPNMSLPGREQVVALKVAADAVADIGMADLDVVMIQDQSAATPYGSAIDFTGSSHQPFKGVTHGQMKFTKMSLVDKFGQVICPISPQLPLLEGGDDDTIFPCLGDQVCPGFIEGSQELNTVTPLTRADPNLPGDYPLCPYVQLPPAINQEARLNVEFLGPEEKPGGAFSHWSVTGDWDNPIWGWVLVNYANYGLQFFTSNGTFFVEMNIGGPTGAIAGAQWLPFDPPSTTDTSLVSPQLDQLVRRLSHPETGAPYLRSFWDMITQAITNMPHAPPEFSQSAAAIIGKPLALVNVGFSLELADEPRTSQSVLLPATLPAPRDAEVLYNYNFPLKIGDLERPYDGVVGFWDVDNTTTGSTDWDTLHTYFHSGMRDGEPITDGPPPTPALGDPRMPIEPDTLPMLRPYYIDPDGLSSGGGALPAPTPGTPTPLEAGSFARSHARQLLVKAALIDPYTPLHAYSPILPIASRQLPAWTVQQAMQRMAAFFIVGPLLLTRDVPGTYDASRPLGAEAWLQGQAGDVGGGEDTPAPGTAPIRLPVSAAGAKGRWAWLQPYSVPVAGGEGSGGVSEESEETRYNALEVGDEDGRIRNDPGPYTMVEGFLQLVRRREDWHATLE